MQHSWLRCCRRSTPAPIHAAFPPGEALCWCPLHSIMCTRQSCAPEKLTLRYPHEGPWVEYLRADMSRAGVPRADPPAGAPAAPAPSNRGAIDSALGGGSTAPRVDRTGATGLTSRPGGLLPPAALLTSRANGLLPSRGATPGRRGGGGGGASLI